MRDIELHRWFSAEELEPCVSCGKLATIYVTESEARLCLECGHVEDSPEPPLEGTKAA